MASDRPTVTDTPVALWRRLRIAHLLLLVPWVLVVAVGRAPIRDNSFLWHVRAGQAQLGAGSVLTSDPFSFTRAGSPWRTQSWLAELGYRWLEIRSGLGFVAPMVIVVSTLTLLTVGVIVWKRLKRPIPVAAVLFIASVLFAGFFNPRPVIFSYLFMGLVVLTAGDRRTRWTLPLITWVWAAVHGSFVLGGAYVAVDGIRRRDRGALRDVLAMGFASLLTAHGWGVVDILVSFARSGEALSVISEWEHPDLLSVPLLPMLAVFLGLIVAAQRGRILRRDWWVILPFLIGGLTAVRSVPPAWLALLPMSVRAIESEDGRFSGRFNGPPTGNLLAAVIILIAPFLAPASEPIDVRRFPVGMTEALDSSHVFHGDGSGGYLIWLDWPERRVFVDDRAELYGAFLPEFVAVRAGQADRKAMFSEYRIDQALLKESDPLTRLLEADGWPVVRRRDPWILLRRP